MLTVYCSGCRETFRLPHRSAEQRTSEHLAAHDKRHEEAVVVGVNWIRSNWDEEEFWSEWIGG